MNTDEMDRALRELADVTIKWCRRAGDPANAVHGDITLVADDFETHAWNVRQKYNELQKRVLDAERAETDAIAELIKQRNEAQRKVDAIESALRYVPESEVHPEGDTISCGWKRAVADVRSAMADPGSWL